MSTAKAEVAAMLAGLPDSASLDDVRYHLDVLQRLKRSLERLEAEGALSDEAAMKRLDQWLTD